MHVHHGFFYSEMNPNNFKKEKKIYIITYLGRKIVFGSGGNLQDLWAGLANYSPVVPGVYTIFRHIRAENTTFAFLSRKRKWYLRVHILRETDFRGHRRVHFWYLKMKPSAHIFVQWAVFL